MKSLVTFLVLLGLVTAKRYSLREESSKFGGCSNNQCSNGAECCDSDYCRLLNLEDGYVCKCTQGFFGRYCEKSCHGLFQCVGGMLSAATDEECEKLVPESQTCLKKKLEENELCDCPAALKKDVAYTVADESALKLVCKVRKPEQVSGCVNKEVMHCARKVGHLMENLDNDEKENDKLMYVL